MVDKNYCMSSFLQFRFVFDENKLFKEDLISEKKDIEKRYIVKKFKLSYKVF